jgi:hypothetical protein
MCGPHSSSDSRTRLVDVSGRGIGAVLATAESEAVRSLPLRDMTRDLAVALSALADPSIDSVPSEATGNANGAGLRPPRSPDRCSVD